jgi:hypothetical protein
VPDGSQWLASGTLYSKNMLISGKNRAVASTYFKADATAPFALKFCRSGALHLRRAAFPDKNRTGYIFVPFRSQMCRMEISSGSVFAQTAMV